MEKKVIERRIYEKKAQKIVERLAEGTVNDADLILLARSIEPYHYEQIVEERFLIQLCGYPLCENELKDIPKQKYHISTKTNKVYDITDRKRYCSNNCYKASKYFSTQISTVPIWSRENNENERNRKITLIDHKNETHEIKKIVLNNDDEIISKSNLYSNEIENELKQIEVEWQKKLKIIEEMNQKQKIDLKEPNEGIFKSPITVPEKAVSKPVVTFQDKQTTTMNVASNVVSLDVVQDTANEISLKNLIEPQVFAKLQETPDRLKLIEQMLNRICNLLTIEARNYIKNENNEYETVQRERETVELYQKHEEMFKKSFTFSQTLNDSDDDASDSEEKKFYDKFGKAENGSKKPLPLYEHIEKSKIEQLKVKEFFKPTIFNDENDDTESNKPILLPEVDSLSQRKIRQKIFQEKLIKNIENILKFSNFSYASSPFEMKNHFKNFVSLLNLTNENIIFKTNEWPIIAIFMLEILSWRFTNLVDLIKKDNFIKTILTTINLNYEILTKLMKYLIYEPVL